MPRANGTSTQQGQTIQANALNIYYEEYGSGEPLILIHGACGTGITNPAYVPKVVTSAPTKVGFYGIWEVHVFNMDSPEPVNVTAIAICVDTAP